jgi:transcriptional regulator NrdR family protein
MICPHCSHPESRVTETRASDSYDKRVRICRNCAKTFVTIERVAVYAGRAAGYIESGPAADLEEADVA